MDFKLPWQKIMRITILAYIILISASSFLMATPVNAQALDKRINVNYKNTSAFTVITELQQKTNTDFGFTKDLNLDKIYVEKLQLNNEEIREVLKALLKGQQIGFKEKAGAIILFKMQQLGRISGKIIDDRGEPLPGANIKIVQTNQSMQSGVDGSYNFSIASGTYTIEVSYISFQTKRITEVIVKANELTKLNVSLKASTNDLQQVTVTGSYKKESVAGLYAVQRNAASVTDGISAEQIARTPDINMAGSIKRISGVTTMNNKYVIVRGMSDRYNQAMLDGVNIPSSSMNKRNFSFDVIPTEVVSSVVVNKTATPDMSAEFSGGQVSVNTLDIPEQNFTTIQLGTGGNAQSTGKDFQRLGQGSAGEFFTFPQEQNKLPENILNWYWHNAASQNETPPPGTDETGHLPLNPGDPDGPKYRDLDAVAQSRRFNADGLKKYKYKAMPYQNYRLSLGRVYQLPRNQRLGFVASTSLRNEQNILDFNNVRGQDFSNANYIDSTGFGQNGAGKSYRSMSSLSGVVNIGYQNDKLKLSLKNLYSRVYQDNYNEAYRLPYSDVLQAPFKEEFQEPELLTLQQHKLEAEYLLPSDFRLQLSGTMNRIGQQVIDQRKLKYRLTTAIGDEYYFQTPLITTIGSRANSAYSDDSRMWSDVDETDYYWQAALTRTLGAKSAVSTQLKIGYTGYQRQRGLSLTRVIPYTHSNSNIEKPYDIVLAPENVGVGLNQAYYYANYYNGTVFDGKQTSHALYAMADQKLLDNKLRLIYGLRSEFFNLRNQQSDFLNRQFPDGIPEYYSDDIEPAEKGWKMLPSLNAIYSVTPKFNVRASYAKTVIRPDLRETSLFEMYDYELDGVIGGRNLKSTTIDNVDLRLEWYPSAGEILSVSGFYKHLDKPIELVQDDGVNSGYLYNYQNQHSAVNYGLEAEIRKSFSFLGEQSWLADMFIYTNGTLMKSKVETMSFPRYSTNPPGIISERRPMQDRPLIGQSPWLVNAGAGYWGDYAGITLNYNALGYRTFVSSADVRNTEFEVLPKQLDLQLYGRFLKKKAEISLNVANLLNEWTFYYRNSPDTYEQVPMTDQQVGGYKVVGDLKYEPENGDIITYRRREGRRFVLSFKYNF